MAPHSLRNNRSGNSLSVLQVANNNTPRNNYNHGPRTHHYQRHSYNPQNRDYSAEYLQDMHNLAAFYHMTYPQYPFHYVPSYDVDLFNRQSPPGYHLAPAVHPANCAPDLLKRNKEMDDEVAKFINELRLPVSAANFRPAVMSSLNNLARFWIRHHASNMSADNLENITFVRPFGSYGLGLNFANSDLDAVFTAPNFVSRDDFFTTFVDLLKQQESYVKDICPVEKTFVPVIKFTFFGLEVDLTFAQLGVSRIPDDKALLSDEMLNAMDEKSIKSLNGWRVCQYLLKEVPDVEMFRTVLTFVKQWATERLIYSNTLGYLGGVSWAILVAYICRINCGQSVFVHLKQFFETFAHWKWSRPVNLNAVDNPHGMIEGGNLEMYPMPILTPCRPYQNSSFNVTRTTLQTIKQEMLRALAFIQMREQNQPCSWLRELVEPRDALNEYGMFLAIKAYAKNEGALKRWKGVVESRLRQLILNLENITGMVRCQIYPKTYVAPNDPNVDAEIHCQWLIGIEHPENTQAPGMRTVVNEFQWKIQEFLLKNPGPQRIHVSKGSSAKLRSSLSVAT